MVVVLVTGLISSPQAGLAPSPAFAAVGEIAAQTIAFELPVPTAAPAADQPAAVAPDTEAPAPENVVEQPAAGGAEEPASTGECTIGAGFPDGIRQWCGLIERYAAENDLEPSLVAAVMLQESGGNAQAYSKSGAVGLMQVMPRDGLAARFQCVNGPCFASRPSIEELSDPEFNIAYGTRMLAGLIRKHGSPREALRAYGPMNMGYHYADLVLGIQERNR
jgi:soluble lytic murein transglycosylase-like protein